VGCGLSEAHIHSEVLVSQANARTTPLGGLLIVHRAASGCRWRTSRWRWVSPASACESERPARHQAEVHPPALPLAEREGRTTRPHRATEWARDSPGPATMPAPPPVAACSSTSTLSAATRHSEARHRSVDWHQRDDSVHPAPVAAGPTGAAGAARRPPRHPLDRGRRDGGAPRVGAPRVRGWSGPEWPSVPVPAAARCPAADIQEFPCVAV
jgi:hypothetical protein